MENKVCYKINSYEDFGKLVDYGIRKGISFWKLNYEPGMCYAINTVDNSWYRDVEDNMKRLGYTEIKSVGELLYHNIINFCVIFELNSCGGRDNYIIFNVDYINKESLNSLVNTLQQDFRNLSCDFGYLEDLRSSENKVKIHISRELLLQVEIDRIAEACLTGDLCIRYEVVTLE